MMQAGWIKSKQTADRNLEKFKVFLVSRNLKIIPDAKRSPLPSEGIEKALLDTGLIVEARVMASVH